MDIMELLKKVMIGCMVLMIPLALLLNNPFATKVVLFVCVACVSAILLEKASTRSIMNKDANKPMQERLGTILERVITVHKGQYYTIQFEDNGEVVNVSAHDGQGPMHLQAGDYGLFTVRGTTIYSFEPKKKGLSDAAVVMSADSFFSD